MDESERAALAAEVVTAVMRDLEGRSGVFDDIEPEMQEEIAIDLRHKVESLFAERLSRWDGC